MRNLLGAVGLCGLLAAVSCNSSDDVTSDPGASGGQGGGSPNGGAGGSSAGMPATGGTTPSQAGTAGTGATAGGNAGGSAGVAGELGTAGEGGSVSSDVSGTLLYGDGIPVSATAIEIGGTIVVTDSAGGFTVPDVAPQYDAYVINAPTQEVFIYSGLSTRSPTFMLYGSLPNNRTANLNGQITGGAGFPNPTGHKLIMGADAAPYMYDLGSAAPAGPGFQFADMAWQGPATLQLNVSALQFSVNTSGLPLGYDGQANAQMTVMDGQTVGKTDGSTAATNLTLTPVTTRTLTGAISPVSDCKLTTEVYTNAGTILSDAPSTQSYSYLLPTALAGDYLTIFGSCKFKLEDAESTKQAFTTAGIGSGNTLDLTLPTPPELSLPVQDATGVTSSTPFRWAAGSDPLTYTQFQTPSWTIYRIGLSSGTTFPDLSRFGIAFPKATTVTWQVTSVGVSGGTGTPEDFFATFEFPVPADSFMSFGSSETWSFTTSP